jgi:hypothetical protein
MHKTQSPSTSTKPKKKKKKKKLCTSTICSSLECRCWMLVLDFTIQYVSNPKERDA